MNQAEVHASLARYWGKAHPSVTSGPDHHTVLGHSLDVAACAFVLVDRHPVLRRQLGADAGVARDAAAITYAAVCALHDVGKLDTRFQRKAPRTDASSARSRRPTPWFGSGSSGEGSAPW